MPFLIRAFFESPKSGSAGKDGIAQVKLTLKESYLAVRLSNECQFRSRLSQPRREEIGQESDE